MRAYWMRLLLAVIICPVLAQPDVFNFFPPSRPPVVRVVTAQMAPLVQLRWQPGLIGNERYEGILVDLLNQVAAETSLDFRIQLATSTSVGSQDKEGKWKGIMGDIVSGTADLALVAGAMSATRQSHHMQFTTPILEARLTLLAARPTRPRPLNSRPRPPQDSSHTRVLENPSIHDYINNPNYQFGVIKNSETLHILDNTQDESLSLIWTKLKQDSKVVILDNLYQGLDLVRHSHTVMIMEKMVGDYLTAQEPCDLVTVGDLSSGLQFGLPVSATLSTRGSIDQALSHILSDSTRWWQLLDPWQSSDCNTPHLSATPPTTSLSAHIVSTETLVITTMLNPPYVSGSGGDFRNDDGVGPKLEGYIIDLVEALSRLGRWKYSLQLVRDGQGLGRRSRGRPRTWNGMIGELLRKEADIAAAPFIESSRLPRVVHLTKPFLHSTLSLLIQAPRAGEDIHIMFMEDLVNNTQYTVGVVKGSQTYKTIRASKEPLVRSVWRRIQANKKQSLCSSLDVCLERVRAGMYVLLLPSTQAAHIAWDQPCDLLAMDQFLAVTNYMFAVRRSSNLALLNSLNAGLLKLQEDGILQQLFHKWWNTDECIGVTESYDPSILNKTRLLPIDLDREKFDFPDFDEIYVTDRPLPPWHATTDISKVHGERDSKTFTTKMDSDRHYNTGDINDRIQPVSPGESKDAPTRAQPFEWDLGGSYSKQQEEPSSTFPLEDSGRLDWRTNTEAPPYWETEGESEAFDWLPPPATTPTSKPATFDWLHLPKATPTEATPPKSTSPKQQQGRLNVNIFLAPGISQDISIFEVDPNRGIDRSEVHPDTYPTRSSDSDRIGLDMDPAWTDLDNKDPDNTDKERTGLDNDPVRTDLENQNPDNIDQDNSYTPPPYPIHTRDPNLEIHAPGPPYISGSDPDGYPPNRDPFNYDVIVGMNDTMMIYPSNGTETSDTYPGNGSSGQKSTIYPKYMLMFLYFSYYINEVMDE